MTLQRNVRRSAFYLCACIVVLAFAVLSGWAYDIQFLKRPQDDNIAMNPTTAVIFILCAVSFFFIFRFDTLKRYGLWAAAFVLIFSSVKLAAVIFNLDIPLDGLLFSRQIEQDAGQYGQSIMPINTAASFILVSAALILGYFTRYSSFQRISILVIIVAIFSVLGYSFDVPEFSTTLFYLPMAIHTAVCFLLFAMALLFIRPELGVMGELTSSLEGSILSRYLIPLIVIIPLSIGVLRLWAHRKGLVSTELGVTLTIYSIMIIFTAIVAVIVQTLNKRDRQRQQIEKDVSELNNELGASNEEMTALNEELTAANEELVVNNEQLIELNDKLEAVNRTIARQKDEQLNRVLDISADVIWSIDLAATQEHYISRSAERIFGDDVEKLAANRYFWADYAHPDDREAVTAAIRNIQEKAFASFTFRMNKVDGKVRWLFCRCQVLLDQHGKPTREIGIATDTTNLFESQQRVREYQKNLDIIFNNTREAFLLLDATGKTILFNDRCEELLEQAYGTKPVTGTSFWSAGNPQKFVVREYFNKAIDGQMLEKEVMLNEGRSFFSIRYEPVLSDGTVTHVCIVLSDITEKKKAALALMQEEERFKAIVENIDDVISISNESGVVQYFSPSAAKTLGYSHEHASTIYFGFEIHPGDFNHVRTFFESVKRTRGKAFFVSFRTRHAKGHWLWLEGSAIYFIEETMRGIVSSFRNVTERKMLEKDLKDNKYFLEKAHATAQIGYWVFNVGGEIELEWSKETCKIFGIGENDFGGTVDAFYEFVHPADAVMLKEQFQRVLEEKVAVLNVDHRIVRCDGSMAWVNEQADTIFDANGEIVQMIGVVQDITHRKETEHSLKQYNERYEILSRATNDAVWDWDVITGIISWNHGLETIFGYHSKESPFTSDWRRSRIHPDDLPAVSHSVTEVFHSRLPNWSHTYRFLTADGEYKYVFDRAYIIYDSTGPLRMIGALQDTTQMVKAMEQIEKLSLVASKTDNVVFILTADQRIEWVNDSFEKLTGYAFAEVKERTPEFLFEQKRKSKTLERLKENILNHESFSGELIQYAKGGREYWVKADITPVFHEDGRLKNYIIIQTDITERKEHELQMISVLKEIESLIENANVPIFGINRAGEINEWNKVSTELSGIPKEAVMGRNWLEEMVTQEYRGACHQLISSALIGTPVSNFELPLRTPNRNLVVLLSASPRRDVHQNIQGVIFVAQDITELIEYRQNLEKIVQDRTRELNIALQKEKELVEMKSKFVSIASHEFRTPLSTISLAAGFLKRYQVKLRPEEAIVKLESIERQIVHMTHLLDDVLVIGKGEAGKIPVNRSDINVSHFFEKVCHEVQESTGNTHRIILKQPPSEAVFQTDEKLMRNIVINLLTNAVKFSPEADRVDIGVVRANGLLTFTVRDKGIGIPEKDIHKLFEPFFRASNVNAIQGTGLGLSIIKKAVDLLNGSIQVDSRTGEGTTITVTLPS